MMEVSNFSRSGGGDGEGCSQRWFVALMVAGLVSIGWSSSASAWKFSSSCAEGKTESFEKLQPQLNLMLDRSGSMGSSTSVSGCQACEYEYYQGATVASGSVSWSSGGARVSTTFSGLSQSSCLAARFDLHGDYNGSSEYASLALDGASVGRLCDGNNCAQCNGPHSGMYPIANASLSDGKLSATVDNSWNVGSFCSANRADISIRDMAAGSTASGRFDCPDCATRQDCRQRLGQPACAVKSATLGTYSCASSLSKWRVASRSIRSVVDDMTQKNPDTAEFGLGMFNRSAWNEVLPQEDAFPAVEGALNSQSPGGGTDLVRAIEQSGDTLAQVGRSSRLQASILITDGKHNDDDTDVIEAACNHQASGDELYVVGFGDGTDSEFNDAVAAAGGSGVCCDRGTGPCSPGDSNVVDLCSMSRTTLDRRYDDGRKLDCSGAYQTDTGTGLKNAIYTIASDLACTIDVGDVGAKKWKDNYYDCAPGYDCFKVFIPGTRERIYHQNSNRSPRGWRWADPTQKEQVVLDKYWCDKVKSLSNNDVEVTRACMCDKPKSQRCYSNTGQKAECACRADRWECQQGVDLCRPYSNANCPTDLFGEGAPCTYGSGVCANRGTTKCNGQGNLFCGTDEDGYTIGQAFHLNAVRDDKWTFVPLKQKNYRETPMVFASTQTDRDSEDPSQAHIRGVSKKGAETQHCEVEIGLNGRTWCDRHGPEVNGWFSFDPGKMKNLRGVDAGKVITEAGSEVHTKIRFGYTFPNRPLVFTQVQTENSSDVPRNSQVMDVTRKGATVEFCQQNSTDGCGPHPSEEISWIAINPANVEFQGFDVGEFRAGSGQWTKVTFKRPFQAAPFVVASVQTENGGEEALYAEVRDVGKRSAEVRFCEYDGNDSCDSHATERVAWMAFGRNDVTSPGYGNRQVAGNPAEDPEVSCDGLDNDCDGKIDEGLGPRRCNTGGAGRCSRGQQYCRGGGWTACKQVTNPVPEICNGLDDDCDGTVDNIAQSWNKSKFSSVTPDVEASNDANRMSPYPVSRSRGAELACGTEGACHCPSASDRDTEYRAPDTKGKNYSSVDREFDEVVTETVRQSGTQCECSE